MKKLMSLVICLVLVLAVVPMFTISASAGSGTYWGWGNESNHSFTEDCYWCTYNGYHLFNNPCEDIHCKCCGKQTRLFVSHTWEEGDCRPTCDRCGKSYPGEWKDLKHTWVTDEEGCCTYCEKCGYTDDCHHSYTDDCDSTCNSCFEERVAPHNYISICDAECNECGLVREANTHIYTDDLDIDCNKCGYVAEGANAIQGACGENVTWVLNLNTKVLALWGTGATQDYNNGNNKNPFIKFSSEIKEIIISDGVTHLGNRLFRGLTQVEKVTFGHGVVTMGHEVFYADDKLTTVKLNTGLTKLGSFAFYNCKSLKQITIPYTVTNIANCAFKGSGLTSITVPDTVKSMGNEVFMDCLNLETVDFTEGVSMLNPRTFENCTSLKTFYFTDNMCRIRARAFYGCTALQSITFENANNMWGSSNGSEAKIASDAFEGCNSTLKMIAKDNSHVKEYVNQFGFVFIKK